MASKPVVMWCPIYKIGDSEFLAIRMLAQTEDGARDKFHVHGLKDYAVRFARVTVSELRDCEGAE